MCRGHHGGHSSPGPPLTEHGEQTRDAKWKVPERAPRTEFVLEKRGSEERGKEEC